LVFRAKAMQEWPAGYHMEGFGHKRQTEVWHKLIGGQ